MKPIRSWFWSLCSLLLFTSAFAQYTVAGEIIQKRPNLILLLVIDQFRPDYLTRFENHFTSARKGSEVGGFRYLMSEGAHFPLAEYDMLQCMTGPGHATLLSGAHPYQMGIPLNYWFDRENGKPQYCVSDNDSPIVASSASDEKDSNGLSPKNFRSTTVGDELKNSGRASKVVSIALKDRASILMGGHRADLATWFDPKRFEWVSSRFYFPDGKLPLWLTKANAKLKKRFGEKYTWTATGTGSGLSDPTTHPAENPKNRRIGASFPHETTLKGSEPLSTPFGVEITTDLTVQALDAYALGKTKGATDILAVSLSTHDYVAHSFGPNSREIEEMTLYEDRAISKLLNAVNKKIPGGLKNVTIVFTADHGGPNSPEYLKKNRIDAGYFDHKKMVETLNSELEKKFGKAPELAGAPQSWIAFQNDFNFYYTSGISTKSQTERVQMDALVKSLLKKLPGTSEVITAQDVADRKLPPEALEKRILRTFIPSRNGDFILIPKPNWMLVDDTVDHVTGYSYDRYVPLIFAGFGIQPGKKTTVPHIVDIAPTLSWILGTMPPTLSEGRVISEALRGK